MHCCSSSTGIKRLLPFMLPPGCANGLLCSPVARRASLLRCDSGVPGGRAACARQPVHKCSLHVDSLFQVQGPPCAQLALQAGCEQYVQLLAQFARVVSAHLMHTWLPRSGGHRRDLPSSGCLSVWPLDVACLCSPSGFLPCQRIACKLWPLRLPEALCPFYNQPEG